MKDIIYKLSRKIKILSPKERLYQLPCPVIGLTGGIATGKSTVSKILLNKNLPLICADVLVKDIYKKEEVKHFIKNNWPSSWENNSINFKTLRSIAFSSIASRTKIEEIIYSFIKDQFFLEFKKLKDPKVLIYDIPLMFEKELSSFFDYKVLVYASEEVQRERLEKRDQLSQEEASLALSNQIDIQQKKKKSDFIILNDHDLSSLENETNHFIKLTFDYSV